MERLSINPYVVRRLHPGEDTLPFPVDDEAVQKLASGYSSDTFVENLEALHQSGRLFFADHSIQARYPANPGRWSAACSGYFFIHQESRDFLPLAIKTNVGSDLIYTPLDCENDWLFAKMAFNTNDLFHGQIYHLSATHDVAEPVHQAALRTLSNRHPVRGYLDRCELPVSSPLLVSFFSLSFHISGAGLVLQSATDFSPAPRPTMAYKLVMTSRIVMYQAYAVRPIGDEFLFNDGGFFDSSFAPTNFGGRSLSSDLYPAWAGRFQAAQFHNDLTARGLINCSYGPELRHMPFHRVVAPMVDAIHEFARAYVDSYYPSDALLVQDKELQNWVQEAVTEAQVLEFPFDAISIPQAAGAVATLPQHSITTRSTLTSILAHMAFLSGVGHHALNAATPGESSGLLPLHPSSFNQPLPTAKGTISSLMPYLHNATEAVKQASLLVRFNRPLLEQQEGSLVHMWSGAEFLARAHPRVREAAVAFRTEMERISDQIRGLGFDERGFARGLGLPFLWISLYPRQLPYYLSV